MTDSHARFLDGKRILITGVCGTVGASLLWYLTRSEMARDTAVIGIDSNENGIFALETAYADLPLVRLAVGDVRDRSAMERAMAGVDVVFHCAALKHVHQCEKSPAEAVKTNIGGVEAVIEAALHAEVGKVIFTSSDKAANPTSVMGTSKLMGERLMTAANAAGNGKTEFASTRFGNVLGSNGSVFHVFRRQIAAGGPLTLTSPEMTRFIMDVRQAVSLVLGCAGLARGGEVFITKMPVAAISDLAAVMIEALAPAHGRDPGDMKVTVTGPRPGEKQYEELMTEEETRRALEMRDYFVILPAFQDVYRGIDYSYPGAERLATGRPYVSRDEPLLSRRELGGLLEAAGLLKI